MNWIKCSEQAPTDSDRFLVTVNKWGFCGAGYYDIQNKEYVVDIQDYEPLYWCYLDMPDGVQNYYD